jgi:glutaredoxin
MTLTVYSKPNCPYCTRAKQTLSDKGISYRELMVGEDISRDEFYALFGNPERLTVPQIFKDDKLIGGYEDLLAYFEVKTMPYTGMDEEVMRVKAKNRAEIKDSLQRNVATVTFTKRDGSTRVMRCTLQESYLPRNEDDAVEDDQRPYNVDTLVVWDLEKKSWRSFRLDSIKRIVVGAL